MVMGVRGVRAVGWEAINTDPKENMRPRRKKSNRDQENIAQGATNKGECDKMGKIFQETHGRKCFCW